MRTLGLVSIIIAIGCTKTTIDPAAGAPPPAQIVPDVDVGLFAVDHPDQFPLVAAVARVTAPELVATGSVSADVTRNVPVVALISGRVVALHARVGDTVAKGQVLLSVRSDDVEGSFTDYRKAVADEVLAKTQLERAQDLYDHGAISQADLQIAQNQEDKAKLDVEAKREHLKLLGKNPEHPSGAADLAAPVAGVITDQQVTTNGVLQASSTAFTISDLSNVWILCDVYENDLPKVRIGDGAEVRLTAYPKEVLKGTIGNISPILDPNLRTAKVRIELANPGLLRLGMFVTATFHGQTQETHVVVPASAVLHLHDRDWVYVPAPDHKFRRVEVVAGSALPDKLQEIKSGIAPGQQLVGDALVLDHAID
jgi:cobalt-zinc-cadmium efflux system membrane fusion protein